MTSNLWTLTPQTPFGAVVQSASADADLRAAVPISLLREWVATHRVVVLRGFQSFGDALPTLAAQLGEILEWDFGAVNHLVVKPDSPNYLFTNRAVPFHWDGAFVGRIPHYILFECEVAPPPDSGGETLFTDTVLLLNERVTKELHARWEKITITYSTEKIVHYGGTFTSPLLARHPVSGEEVIRYAEPVEDLNPVTLEIHGLADLDRAAFLEEMRSLLYDPSVCYAHSWREGDIVIADNHATLHARRAFVHAERRHIRRVNIL